MAAVFVEAAAAVESATGAGLLAGGVVPMEMFFILWVVLSMITIL